MHWSSASNISRRSTPSVGQHRTGDQLSGISDQGERCPPSVERALALINTPMPANAARFDDEEVDFSVVRPVTMSRQRASLGTPASLPNHNVDNTASGGTLASSAPGRLKKRIGHPSGSRGIVLHPIHSLKDADRREFHAWPAERTLGSSSLHPATIGSGDGEGGGPITDPLSVKEIRNFIAEELCLVPPSDSVGRLNIYREAMDQVIGKCTTLAPLLCTIRDAYNKRLSELEEVANSVLMGDTELRREKEKCLTVQSDTIAAMELERRETDRCKLELFASQEKQQEMEKEMERLTKNCETRIAAAEKLMVMEKVGRLEAESTLETVHRLYRELREEHASLQQLHRSDRAASTALVKSLHEKLEFAELERRSMAQNFADHLELLEKQHKEQLSKMIGIDEHEETRVRSEQVNLANRALQQRVTWLTEQLSKKNDHEAPIDWSSVGSDFVSLKEGGRSSQELVKVLCHRVSRAQRSEESMFREWMHLFALKNIVESSDIALVFDTHAKLVLQQWTDKTKQQQQQPSSTQAAAAVVPSTPPPMQVLRGLLSPVVADIATKFAINPLAEVTSATLFSFRDQIEKSIEAAASVPALTEKRYKTFPPSWCTRNPAEVRVEDIRLSYETVKAVAVSSIFALLSAGSSKGCDNFFQAVEHASGASRGEIPPHVYFANLVAGAERFVGDSVLALFLAALRGTFFGIWDLSGVVLTSVRAVGLCLNKTHEILNGSPPTASAQLPDRKLPLRAVRSALKQVFFWKTTLQKARLVTKMAVSIEALAAAVNSASLSAAAVDTPLPPLPGLVEDGESVLYHWVFGGFTTGAPSPLAIELVDQAVDEMLFTAQCASFMLSLESRKKSAPQLSVSDAIAAVGNITSLLQQRPSSSNGSKNPEAVEQAPTSHTPVLSTQAQAAFLVLPAVAKQRWSAQRFRCFDMPRLLAEDKPQWSPPQMLPTKSAANLRSVANLAALKSSANFSAEASGGGDAGGLQAVRNPDDVVADMTRELKLKQQAVVVRPCLEEIEAWQRENQIDSSSLETLIKSIRRMDLPDWFLRPNFQNGITDEPTFSAIAARNDLVDVSELCSSLLTYSFFFPWK